MKETNFNLPKPSELVKRTKEETVPVSLRMKESTYAGFEKIAKESGGVKASAIINSLCDYYIQANRDENDNVAVEVMLNFLNSEKYWKKLGEMSEEDLIYHFNAKGLVWPLHDEYDSAFTFANYYTKEFNPDVEENDSVYICPYSEFHNDIYIDIHICKSKEEPYCKISDDADDIYEVSVKKEQWPLVCALVCDYGKKFEKLFSETNLCITPKMLEKIVEACKNSKTNVTLATAIKNTFVEYVEGLDE